MIMLVETLALSWQAGDLSEPVVYGVIKKRISVNGKVIKT